MLLNCFLSRFSGFLKNILALSFAFLAISCAKKEEAKPKLVIGIVVDQMRYDYLQRFDKYFAKNNGFSRFKQGANYTECRYSYLPTYTGPGFATIFTGTVPKNHGIVGNDWYDAQLGKFMYCASDSAANTIGSNPGVGEMTTRKLLVDGLGDSFKAHFGAKSKVYGLGIKDRSSIFSAGKSADMAFWYDASNGSWISSTHYHSTFPAWATSFNELEKANEYLNQDWELSKEAQDSGVEDNQSWERPFKGLDSAVFPYELSKLRLLNGNFAMLKQVPAGNDFTLDFARTLILNEKLGRDSICDFLSLCFSPTDYVGHRFGTESLELVDIYVKLDKALEEFFKFLDNELGEDSYTVFLSADHGAAPPAGYSQAKLSKGGAINILDLEQELDSVLEAKFEEEDIMKALVNQQVYLHKDLSDSLKIEVKTFLKKYLASKDYIEEILDTKVLGRGVPASYAGRHYTPATNGYHPNRTGDLWFFYKPYWVEYTLGGSTHGSIDEWDIHVPFMVFGPGIKPEINKKPLDVQDIAPTA